MKNYPKMTTAQKLEWLKCKAEGLIEQTNLMDQHFDQERRYALYQSVKLIQHQITLARVETPKSWFDGVLIGIRDLDKDVQDLFDKEINEMVNLARYIKVELSLIK
jgi:hypothetical protein